MVVVALAVVTTVEAQLKLGVKGGLDITEMSFKNDVFNADNRMGWFVGPTLKFSTFTGLGFDISALYNQRESKIDLYTMAGDGSSNSSQVDALKTKQVIVPLNVRYTIGVGDVFNVFGFAGPQVAFRVGDESQSLTDLKETAVEWRLRDSNFSVNLGAGITFDHLQVTANYNVGVGKTGDVAVRDAVDAAVKGGKGHYNSWQISLAYFF